MEAVGGGDADAAEAAASELYADYARTVYPNQARLAMARLYMDKGRDQEAAQLYQRFIDAWANAEGYPADLVARAREALATIRGGVEAPRR